jgi:hypothetical protein
MGFWQSLIGKQTQESASGRPRLSDYEIAQLQRELEEHRATADENLRLTRRIEELVRQNDDLRKQVERALAPKVTDLPAPAPNIPDSQRIDLGTGLDAFAIAVVGESRRQVALRELAGDRRKRGEEVTFTALLIPEPDNPVDPNAIKVHINGGAHVGYLSADDAVSYKAVADALTASGRTGACRARLIGGTKGKWSIGVVLDLESPQALLARLAGEAQPF